MRKKQNSTIIPLNKMNKGAKTDNDYKLLYKELHRLNESQKSELEDAKLNVIRLRAQINSITDKYTQASDKLIHQDNFENKFKYLQRNLVGCLSKDELEASHVTGCLPELYAIELLKIFQEWKNHNKKPEDFGKNNTYRGY
jgi:hypothetical protein